MFTIPQFTRFYTPEKPLGILGRLKELGATFYNNTALDQNDIDADFAVGTDTATFTASRGASNPATYVEVQSGNALVFDGSDDDVSVNSFSPSGSTFTFCFNVTSTQTGVGLISFLFDSNPNRFVLAWSSDSGSDGKLGIYDGAWQDFGDAPDDGGEHSVIFEVDGTSAKCYVDNVQSGSTLTITATDLSSATETSIGSEYDGAGVEFEGTLKDIRVFNRVLTESERSTYGEGSAIATPINHWDFSDGSGSTLTDVAGSDNGTISGATWLTDGSVIVKTTTASDTPRWTSGYYDSTGYNAGKGLLYEGASTNLVPKSEIMNDATWAATNVTVADAEVVAPSGSTTAASLTSTAGNGTVQLTTAVTAQTYSVWLKRKTGTGNIDITADSGATWTTVTLSSSAWYRFSVTAASASQKCGIRIVTSADAVYAWGNQFEAAAFPSSYIPTTSAALTRNAETLTYVANDGNFSDHLGQGANALYFDATDNYVGFSNITVYEFECKFSVVDASRDWTDLIRGAGGGLEALGVRSGFIQIYDVGWKTTTVAISDNTVTTIKIVWNGSSGYDIYKDGVHQTFRSTSGVPLNVTSFGQNSSGFSMYGTMYTAKFWDESSVLTNSYDHTNLAFGATTLPDTVGSNDGTISGATVIGTDHSGTIAMVYRPVMLPDEQAADYKRIMQITIDASNEWLMAYRQNSDDKVGFNTQSGGTWVDTISSAEPFSSSRYSLRSAIGTFSTTADGASKKQLFYVDGVQDGTSASYTPPVGALPAAVSLQPSTNQGMILVAAVLFKKSLSATEAASLHTLLTS